MQAQKCFMAFEPTMVGSAYKKLQHPIAMSHEMLNQLVSDRHFKDTKWFGQSPAVLAQLMQFVSGMIC